MNKHFFLKALFSVFVLFILNSGLDAQSKDAVILINAIPFNVVLSPDGEIEEVKGEAVGYMRGFIRSADEFDVGRDVEGSITDNAPGISVRSERRFVDFEAGYATLDQNASAQLDEIYTAYRPSSEEKILISAFKGSEDESDELYNNRIQTCKTYLELKGIPAASILTEIQVSSALVNRITVSYVEQ